MTRQSKGAIRRQLKASLAAQGIHTSDPLAYIRAHQINTGPTRFTTLQDGQTVDDVIAERLGRMA